LRGATSFGATGCRFLHLGQEEEVLHQYTKKQVALVLCMGAIVAVFAAPAAAGSGGVSGSTVFYTAPPGEANIVTVTKAGAGHIEIQDNGTASGGAQIQVVSTGGCTVTTTTFTDDTLDCSGLAPGTTLFIATGDGSDSVTIDSSIDAGTGLAGIQIDGGDGNDNLVNRSSLPATFVGGTGDDVIEGGGGSDTVDYAPGAAVSVNLQAGTATGQGSDSLANVENVIGSSNNDSLTGDANANTLNGGLGNDVLVGRGGDDVLSGGPGTDDVGYQASQAPVVVDLGSGTATGEGFDLLSGIEDVVGSNYSDTLTGDNADNVLSGGAGSDTLVGGGGNDTLVGGNGSDTVDYSSSPSAVNVDLTTGVATADGFGASDTLSGLENVVGSASGDQIDVREGTINSVTCGAGSDSVTADAFDNVAGDCESIAYPAPVVTTNAATGMTKQSATMQGSVNPKGLATTYHFEWGTTTAYGKSTPTVSAGSGQTSLSVSAGVTKLKPHTTYHYRLVATSSAGTSAGADVTFTTS
jgi:Ca2+-binding RTX toxin-like protein